MPQLLHGKRAFRNEDNVIPCLNPIRESSYMLVKDQLHNYASQRHVALCEGQRGGVDTQCCVRANAPRSVLMSCSYSNEKPQVFDRIYNGLLMIELHIK